MVISPVDGRQRFQMLVPHFLLEGQHDTESPFARLRSELEGSSSEESCEAEGCDLFPKSSVLSLEEIIGNRQRMPYLLDFLHQQGGQSCRLLLLIFACEQHRRPRVGRNSTVRDALRAHECSVFATYVAKDAPKQACNSLPWQVVARLAARNSNGATPELNALSELRSATLRELKRRWDERFRNSEAYRALLRDAIKSRDAVLCSPGRADALEEEYAPRTHAECRRFVATLRTFLTSLCHLNRQVKGQTTLALRVFRWWRRLAGRLKTLCSSCINTEKSSFLVSLKGHNMKQPNCLKFKDDEGYFIHARSELRGAAHRLLVRPPAHEQQSIIDNCTLEKISVLLRRERSAFKFSTAAAMYGALFNDCATQLETWLNIHVFTPFHSSQIAGELAVAEAHDCDIRTGHWQTHDLEKIEAIYDAANNSQNMLQNGTLLLWDFDSSLRRGIQSLGINPLMTRAEAIILIEDGRGIRHALKGDTEPDIDGALAYCGSLEVCGLPKLFVAILLDYPVGVRGHRALEIATRIAALGDAVHAVASGSPALPHCKKCQIHPSRDTSHGPTTLVLSRGYSHKYREGLSRWNIVIEVDRAQIMVATGVLAVESPPPPPLKASRTLARSLSAAQAAAVSLRDDADGKTRWRKFLQIENDDSESSDSESCGDSFKCSGVPVSAYTVFAEGVRSFINEIVLVPLRLFAFSHGTASRKFAVFHVGNFLQQHCVDIEFYTAFFASDFFRFALESSILRDEEQLEKFRKKL